MVKNLIVIEDAYINTAHPDFMGGANAIFNVFDPNSYKEQQVKLDKAQQEKNQLVFEDITREETKSTGKTACFKGKQSQLQ